MIEGTMVNLMETTQITISDGTVTQTIAADQIENIEYDEAEFSSYYQATWYIVTTDTDVLIADKEHMDGSDWEALRDGAEYQEELKDSGV